MRTQSYLALLLLAFAELAFADAPTYRVFATREGLVGGTTANGHIITTNDRFVALPSGTVLDCNGCRNYTVTITYGSRSVTAPVWDVGPWNTKDNYWHSPRQMWTDLVRGLPEAQAAYQNGYNGGRDQFGRLVANPAGIDLADGTFWYDLGMVNNDWVYVRYNWENVGPTFKEGYAGGIVGGINYRCADVDHGNTADGTKIQTWDCNGSNPQVWRITAAGELRNKMADKCMAISGGVSSAGKPIIEWSCVGQADAKWKFQNMELVTFAGKCIDVPNSNFTDGQAVQLYNCNGTNAQKWTYDPATKLIKASTNNKCLDVRAYGTANGTFVQVWTCNASATNQQWDQGSTGFRPRHVANKCLDVAAGGTANGTKIQIWDCLLNNNQRFALRGPIVNSLGNCLDIPNSNSVNGQQLQIYTCNGTAAQKWAIWSPI